MALCSPLHRDFPPQPTICLICKSTSTDDCLLKDISVPIQTVRYLRKPLYVDAVKITPDNFVEVAAWCQGEIRRLENDAVVTEVKIIPTECYVRVRVHNPKSPRQTQLRVGDWLLYTDRGYKVYTEKAFFNSFEVAEPVSVQDQAVAKGEELESAEENAA